MLWTTASSTPTQDEYPREPVSLGGQLNEPDDRMVVHAEVTSELAELGDRDLSLKLSVRAIAVRYHNFASVGRFPTLGVGVL